MRARARTVWTWRELTGARDIWALVLLAATFAFRSAVTWRRWQRLHPARAMSRVM